MFHFLRPQAVTPSTQPSFGGRGQFFNVSFANIRKMGEGRLKIIISLCRSPPALRAPSPSWGGKTQLNRRLRKNLK